MAAGLNKTLHQLKQALRRLDVVLGQKNKHIEVRAMGGYALMEHGIRPDADAFTVDIDSLTDDFDPEVLAAIHQVAEEQGLYKHWLNNELLGEKSAELLALQYEARWIPAAEGYDNIKMSYADIPTLTRSKYFAVDSWRTSERDRDKPDLVNLLKRQGIKSVDAFNRAYPGFDEEYPDADEFVREQLGARPKGRDAQLSALHRQFPWLADGDGEFDESSDFGDDHELY